MSLETRLLSFAVAGKQQWVLPCKGKLQIEVPALQCLLRNGIPPVYPMPLPKNSPKARRGAEQSNLNDQGIGASFLWGMYKSVGLFSDGL